jgi:hypothetical protein
VFNIINQDDKIVLVAIDMLSDDQIIKLYKFAKETEKKGGRIVGIHKARARLAILFQLTEDKRYKPHDD